MKRFNLEGELDESGRLIASRATATLDDGTSVDVTNDYGHDDAQRVGNELVGLARSEINEAA